MGLTYNDEQALIDWAEARGEARYFSDAKAIGKVSADGELQAVTIFDRFQFCECSMHVVSDGSGHWLTRGYLCAVFAYPFVQCRFRRVTALVPAKNTAALQFDLHLGFEREGRCRHALPDDDLLVLGMLKENCKFIPREYRHD